MTRRRLLRIAAIVLVCFTVEVASAAAQTPARVPLAATVSTCTTGLDAAERAVVFSGSMPAVRDAVRMAMRFDLYERDGTAGPFRRLAVTGFGGWERSQRNVAGFVYDKRVQMLQAPAAYRVTVRFRWYDAGGRIVRRSRRVSAPCRQPDLRPDLRVVSLRADPGQPGGQWTYTVTVRNHGDSQTSVPFLVGLSVGGAAQPPRRVTTLPAGAVLTLIFEGPACLPGSAIVATADTDAGIDEADEDDNATRVTCLAVIAAG